MATGNSTVSADQVYLDTRSDILACRLAPGAKLKIRELCERFDVSLGAVREALSRLSAEGLVIFEAQRGSWVAPVSLAELRDLTEARIAIEGLCLERAMRQGGVEWEAAIVSALHHLSRTPTRAEGDDQRMHDHWATAHRQFHNALVSACDNASLLRMRTTLYEQGERYQRLAVPLGRTKRNVGSEHKKIATAVLARNVPEALEAMRLHLTRTADIVAAGMAGETTGVRVSGG